MDPIDHALDDFDRAKDSDALDIETIGNLVDSVLRTLYDLILPGVAIFDFGDRVAFETVQLNISMQ